MNLELKIKASSLAAEARIIRNLANSLRRRQGRALGHHFELEASNPEWSAEAAERAKTLRSERLNITEHRRFVVRPEARATHLARAFLGGMPYKRVETKVWTQPDWAKVVRMVEKYKPVPDQDNRPVFDRIKEWRETV